MTQEKDLNSEKISSWLKKGAKEEPELIEQFFVTLSATFQQIKVNNPTAVVDTIESIDDLLKVRSWKNAYEIERLFVDIYDEKTLDVEVDRRLVEAKTNLSENLSSHYAKKVGEIPKVDDTTTNEKKLSIVEEKRAILNRMLNDLQWKYALKETSKKYSRDITYLNGYAFIISAIIFGVMIVLGELFDWIGNLDYLVIALGAGLVGASFSMVVNSKSRLAASSFDELKVLRRPIYVIIRALIGLGAALILYFILQAGILAGSVFPNFTPPELVTHKTSNVISEFIIFDIPDTTLKKDEFKKEVSSFLKIATNVLTSDAPGAKDTLTVETGKFLTSITTFSGEELQALTSKLTNKLWVLNDSSAFLDFKNLALLIFWSILAGFSEKFVPNLLAKAEEKAKVK